MNIQSSLLLGAAAFAFVSTRTSAQTTYTWNGNGAGWTTVGNWTPSAPTSGHTTGADDALFDATAVSNFTSALVANQSVRKITFHSPTSYTIRLYSTTGGSTPRALSVGIGGFTVSAGNHTILGAKGGSGTTGSLLLGAGTTSNVPFNVASGCTLTFDARLRQISTPTYSKSGSGVLVLNADNSGTSGWSFAGGGFTITEGILRFNASGAYGTSGVNYNVSPAVGLQAAMELSGGVSQTVNGGKITLQGTGVAGNGALRSLSGDNIITGAQVAGVGGVVLGADSCIGVDSGSLAINHVVSGGFALTKVGGGTLALSGMNTYSGGSTVTAGTLSFVSTVAKPASGTHTFGPGTTIGLGVAGALPFLEADVANAFIGTMTGNLSNVAVDSTTNVGIDTTGGAFTFGTSIPGSPSKGLVKLGTNLLMLGGNQTYTGGSIINAGTLQFSQLASMPAVGTVAVQSGATLAVNVGGIGEFSNATTGHGSIGGLLAGLGGQSGSSVSYIGDVTLGIDTTNAPGGALSYAGAIGNVGSTLGLAKLGSGTLTLTGATNYTGATTISGGALEVQVTISSTSAIANSGSLILNSTTPQTYGVAITGTGSLTQAGSGTLTLTGTNTYTGSTTVSAGILQIGNGVSSTAGTLGNNSHATIVSGATLRFERYFLNGVTSSSDAYIYAGTLSGEGIVQVPWTRRIDFSTNQTSSGNLSFVVDGLLAIRTGSGVTAVQIGELTGSGFIQRGSSAGGAATISIGGKNTNSLFTGIIGSTELSVNKIGAGILTLTGSNGYGGPTTISAGTLSLGNATNTLPSTPVSIGSATLAVGAACTDTVGTLDVTGAATIDFGSGGSLVFSDSSAVNSGDWGGTLNLTGTFVSGASLKFGATSSGLTAGQLAKISAAGWTGFALDANGFLTASPVGGGFSSWITGTFANGNVPNGKQGPSDDPDNDGINNLMEYAIAGQDPTVANSALGSFDGTTLAFSKRNDAIGVTYSIEESISLGLAPNPWTPVSGSPPQYINDSTTISYSFPVGGPGKDFLRLKVVAP